jgi:hypothetical protein
MRAEVRAAGSSMACKGSGVQNPSAPPGTTHLVSPAQGRLPEICALSAIVVNLFVDLVEQTDDHKARDGRGHIRPASLAPPLSAA